MDRFGIALAILIAVYAALLFGPLFVRAAKQFERHAMASDDETVRQIAIGGAAVDDLFRTTARSDRPARDFELFHSSPVVSKGQHRHG